MSPNHGVVKSDPDVLPHRSFIVSYDFTFFDIDKYRNSERIRRDALNEAGVPEIHSPNNLTLIL